MIVFSFILFYNIYGGNMNFKDIVGDNLLIICDDDIKNKILSFLSTDSNIYDIKFMNINEVIKKLFFDYDKRSIYYLVDKYNIPCEIANIYMKNMYFVEDKKYDNDKLDMLIKYKNELIDNNLLIFDDLFKEYIKSKKIKVIMKKISKYDRYIFGILEKYTEVEIIDFNYDDYKHKVYEFNTLDKEVEYVAYSICDLINKKVDINKIKISNIDDEYISSIKRIFSSFNIPINLPNNSYLIGTKIVKDFIDNYESNISNTIEKVSSYKDNPIYNKIIDICNKYTFIDDFNKVKDLIINDFENTKLPNVKYTNAIEVVDYKNIFEDEYVFLMNFNLKSIPKVYKDEDFITDSIKPEFLDTTLEKNKLEKDITTKSINSIKNLVITYKDMTPSSECYPSNLIDGLEIEKPSINIYKSYSKINDELKLATSLDRLKKYGSRDSELNILKYNYDIPYMAYSNDYEKVSTSSLCNILNNKLSLSYSKIEEYNECPFKYYLSNVLKINIYEENFGATLGTLFHHILEIGINKDIDIDKEIEKYLNEKYSDKKFSNMEKFFIENAKENIIFALDTINMQMKYCKLNNILTEKKIYINKDKNIKVTFSGIIDKLLFDDENKIVAIIDYKSGNSVDIDLGYMKYGIGLQLPIYLYLTDNMDLKDIKIAGIYLQKVMPDIEKKEESKENLLKLEGYSNVDKDIIEKFDSSYEDSKVIKGLKTKLDGQFNANSKVLSNKEFDMLKTFANNQIDLAIDNILDAKFSIKPVKKETEQEITACKFCKYKDICFRTNDDIVNLKKDNDLSFLGGDINA